MAVSLTVSKTFQGAAVSDSLSGGETGVDLGSVTNGAYAPLTDQPSNTGKQDLYISHDAVTDPITDVGTYIAQYSGTYGGQRTAASDYADIKGLGNASDSSKNNGDGLSGGLWVEMDRDVATASQFDQAARPTFVKIYGDNGTDGQDLASAFTIKADAMARDNTGEDNPTAPVDGQIGKSGDQTLGEAAHLALRIYLPDTHSDGGVFQFDYVVKYSFTA